MDATEQTFERDVIEASAHAPVVVDFWGHGCPPCDALSPVLERAVAEREGFVLVKVNLDENEPLAARFGIQAVPTVKAFRHGSVVAGFVGAQPSAAVAAFLDGLD